MGDVSCCATTFWVYMIAIVGLVSFAGLMAGLTLGLMSLGLVDLEVLIKSGRPQDRIHAAKIFPVVKNQHLLLCTLLIGNSLAMESLPIFLDKLVKPWAAILISVTLILLFGEILPQAICTRYGMKVGAATAPIVRVLLFLFYPVAYPISKILDLVLGKGQSALLRRAELKTFVDFHGNEAGKGGDLTHDETTIIAGALEMTAKTAKDAMTPIFKAFSLDLDGALDLQTWTNILAKGHSRIPVYAGNPTNIVGLILVKNLLTIDPNDTVPLKKMTIRKIPRVSENMPLYDMLNEFQKGQSHIAVVIKDLNQPKEIKYVEVKLKRKKRRVRSDKSKHTPDPNGASPSVKKEFAESQQLSDNTPVVASGLKKRNKDYSYCILDVENSPIPEFPPNEQVVGVITMEDVIEELLQEEILDETDEYVNIHNRIKINMSTSRGKSNPSNSQETSSASSLSMPYTTPSTSLTSNEIDPSQQSSISSTQGMILGPASTLSISTGTSGSSSPTTNSQGSDITC